MTVGVVVFPGTNCDVDVMKMVQLHGHTVKRLWHKNSFNSSELNMILIPGGFSYGDYLRCGALAARSPVMNSVREFAKNGKPVLGICNGFQILCESGLLPGALVKNQSGQFVDDWSTLTVKQSSSFFKPQAKVGDQLNLPVAHGEGRFFAPPDVLSEIEDKNQIWLTYTHNFNGSLKSIAGICNQTRNVYGLMPHPERALLDWMGESMGWGLSNDNH